MARMEADDAADLVAALPEERRELVVQELHPVQRRRLRALLGYDPATAGGLMSPDFVCVYSQATREEALDADPDRARACGRARLDLRDEHPQAAGRARCRWPTWCGPTRARASASSAAMPQRVRADADIEEVARLMTDFDLTVVPVVDDEDRLVGVVTVDDVLELVVPKGWRRRFGLLGED